MSAENLTASQIEEATAAPATKPATPQVASAEAKPHHAAVNPAMMQEQQTAAAMTDPSAMIQEALGLDPHPRMATAAVEQAAAAPIAPEVKSLAGAQQVAAPQTTPPDTGLEVKETGLEPPAAQQQTVPEAKPMQAETAPPAAPAQAPVQAAAAAPQADAAAAAQPGQLDMAKIVPLLQAQPRDDLTNFFRQMVTQQAAAEGQQLTPDQIEGHALFMRFLLEANNRQAAGQPPIPEGIELDQPTRATLMIAITEFGKRMNENNMTGEQVQQSFEEMQPPVKVDQRIINELMNQQILIDEAVKNSPGDKKLANVTGAIAGVASAALATLGAIGFKGYSVFKQTNDYSQEASIAARVGNTTSYIGRLVEKVLDSNQRPKLYEQTKDLLKDGWTNHRGRTIGTGIAFAAGAVLLGGIISFGTQVVARAMQDRAVGRAYRKIDEALEPLGVEEQTATLNAWQERLAQRDELANAAGKIR